MFANNALLGGGVRVRVWIREQRKIKRRSKALLSLWWQTWPLLELWGECWVLSLSLSTSSSSRCLQFPQHYAAISETNQPAELIPQFSTIEYQLQVMHAQPPRFISLSSKLSSLIPLCPYLVDLHLSFIPSPCLLHTLSFSVQVLPPPSSSLLWIPARMKKTFKLSRYHPDGSNHWKCIVCLSILLTVVYSKLKHLYK